MPPELERLIYLVADKCASMVEEYALGDCNAADEIRALFGLG